MDIVRTGNMESLKNIWISICLGVWPAIEVFFVQKSINVLAHSSPREAVWIVVYLFGCGAVILLLFSLQPYFRQKFRDRIYESLSNRFFTLIDSMPADHMLVASTRNNLEATRGSINMLHGSGLSGGLMLFQTMFSALSLSVVLVMAIPWSPLVILAGVVINMYITGLAAGYETKTAATMSEPGRWESNLLQILSSFSYAKELRLYGIARWVKGKWEARYRQFARQSMAYTVNAHAIRAVASIVTTALMLFLVVMAVLGLRRGQLEPGDVAAIFIGGSHLDQLFFMALIQGKDWIGRKVYLEPLWAEPANDQVNTSQSEEHEGGLHVRHVSYIYPDSMHPVIQNVSFSIARGEKVAIVGPNGAGKSTLIQLVLGLFQPATGEIRSDPVGGVCFQKHGRYKMTLAENVTLGDVSQVTDADNIDQALNVAKADFAAMLPHRTDTLLWPEAGGVQLSDGQWQKVGIARALFRSVYRNGSIVVLDEPTSVLDPQAELALLQSLMDRLQGYTVLFIVHRLVGCAFADKVMVMNEGRVEAIGTHEELAASHSLYKDMWQASSSFMRS